MNKNAQLLNVKVVPFQPNEIDLLTVSSNDISETTFIGNMVDLINASGLDASSIKSSILKKEAYQKGDSSAESVIQIKPFSQVKAISIASESMTKIAKSLEVNAEVRTGKMVPFFSGGISAKYGESSEATVNSQYYKGITEIVKFTHNLNSNHADANDLKPLINNNVLKDIDDERKSAKAIFSKYGTHMIASCGIGGRIEINATSESKGLVESKDLKIAIDAACAYASGSASTNITKIQESIVTDSKITAFSTGGNVDIGGKLSYSTIASLLTSWNTSINRKEDLGISGASKYIAIWEFCSNATRKTELENAFYDICASREADLNQYSVKATPLEVGATYQIVNVKSGKVMGVYERANVDRTGVLQLAEPNSTPHVCKAWRLEKVGDKYGFCFVSSGKYLDVEGGSRNDWAKLQLFAPNNTVAQQFDLRYISGSNCYNIVNVNSGKAVDIAGGETATRCSIVQYQVHAEESERWRLYKLVTS